MTKKIIFIDRDGTLIDEPEDKQVDSLEKIRLKKNVIPALLTLKNANYSLVMITNQDGMGTKSFPQPDFDIPQNMIIEIFKTQGIIFDNILICPHFESDNCQCRKPGLDMVIDYIRNSLMNFRQSFVIGDRDSDIQLAKNMGINSILYTAESDWLEIARTIITIPRTAITTRETNETNIQAMIDLDKSNQIEISTGIHFFDHMLEQLAKHAGFSLKLDVRGDLQIDEHHTVEDTAIVLGEALKNALGDKLGIARYGFVLPMDESRAQVCIDLSGRNYSVFEGKFTRDKVGDLPTELISHFFYSFSCSLGAAIHIIVTGENTHHMIESIFKCVGRALRQAISRKGFDIPSTKGIL